MKTTPRLLAVDPSLSATGIALFEGKDLNSVYLIKTNKENKDRFFEIAWRFTEALEKFKPNTLAIETQYISVRSSSVIKVIEVKGLLEGLFYSYCLKYSINPVVLQIHPNTAKQAVGVKKMYKRKESKIRVKAAVCHIYPQLEKQTQDVMDAIAIGIAGLNEVKRLSAEAE